MQKWAPYCVGSGKSHTRNTAGGGNRVYIAVGVVYNVYYYCYQVIMT
jgi:hypothetical protein